jgi:hypothetical protein
MGSDRGDRECRVSGLLTVDVTNAGVSYLMTQFLCKVLVWMWWVYRH